MTSLPAGRALDGRYPLNEFQCAPHMWTHVVDRLAARADVVLMDLRGWHTNHSGATFELSLAMDRLPLSRIVVLIDRYTEEPELATTVAHAWSQLTDESVNAWLPKPCLSLLRCSGRRPVDAAAIANRVFVAAKDVRDASAP